MKFINRAGLLVLVLGGGLAATVSGCDTSLATPPFSGAPTVTNIYAVDLAAPQGGLTTALITGPFGISANSAGVAPAQLPDVQLYSATDSNLTSPFPPTYGGIRIEFSQPVDPTTVANQANVSGATSCTPLATPSIALTNGAGGTGTAVLSSVCYDPSSALGQHPNVVVTIGAGAASGQDPFTCAISFSGEQFLAEDLASNPATGSAVHPWALKPATPYTLTVDVTKIKTTSGTALQAPANNTSAGGQWSGSNFTMTTAQFDLMAIGYQDPNTGFFSWLDKPYKGFEKDLAADPHWSDCAPTPNKAAPCIPSDDTPLMLVFNSAVAADPNGFPEPSTSTAGAVTSTRADGTDYQPFISVDYTGSGLNFNGDPRIIWVAPGGQVQGTPISSRFVGGRWEPNGSFKLTVPGTLESCDAIDISATSDFSCATPGPAIASSTTGGLGAARAAGAGCQIAGADLNCTFKSQSGSPEVAQSYPASGAIAIPMIDVTGRFNGGFVSQVQFTVPVLDTGAGSVSPSTYQILDPSGNPVPPVVNPNDSFDVAVRNPNSLGLGTDNQTARATVSPLLPGKTYTVKVSGVKQMNPDGTPGATIPDYTATFTTATFRISAISRTCHDFPFNRECANAFAGPGGTTASIDRGANVPLSTLENNDLRVTFTNTANGVSDTTAPLEDHTASPLKPLLATWTANPAKVSGSGAIAANQAYHVQVTGPDATGSAGAYAVKCGTRYDLTATPAITDPNGTKVNAEGCTPSATNDCSDVHFFTTEAFAPQAVTSSRALFAIFTSTPSAPTAPALVPEAPPAAITGGCTATQPCFSLRFNEEIDHTSVDPQLATCTTDPSSCPIKLTQSGSSTNIALNCPALGDDTHFTIWCAPTTALTPNGKYTIGSVFLQSKPVKIATTVKVLKPDLVSDFGTTMPGDQTTCQYFGSTTRTFTLPSATCP